MAEAAKLEISTRDAILAIGFVGLVILGIALVQAGYITNPLSLGLMVTLSIGLILVGHILVKAGVFSPSALLLWYVFAFGLVMAVYGGIVYGYIPVAFLVGGASVNEIAITNAMFYVLVVLAVVAAIAVVYACYQYYKRRALGV